MTLDPRWVADLVRESFSYLETDYGLQVTDVRLDKEQVSLLFARPSHGVRIRWWRDDGRLLVELLNDLDDGRLPERPGPSPTLADLAALRGTKRIRTPAAFTTEADARAGLAAAASELREFGDSALWGSLGPLTDHIAAMWGKPGRPGVDWWASPPYDDPLFKRRRTRRQVARDDEFAPIHGLTAIDPEAAWPKVVAFVRRYPGTPEAIDLIEDLIYGHGPAFIDRIEIIARSDRRVGDAVADAVIGGIAGPAIERFDRLQVDLRRARGRSEE